MATEPLKTLLYRELSIADAKGVISIASPLLQELVNYATNAFARCASSTSREVNVDLATLLLYLHIIEMTDGVEVLLSQSCAIPAIPLVRSSFEALISIEYILESDYVNRSLAWLVEYVHQRLAIYETHDPNTDRGRSFQISMAKDEITKNLTLPDPLELKNWTGNLQQFLYSTQIQPIELKYQNTKTRGTKRLPWYKLFNGPSNLHDLAKLVNRGGQYEILYSYWSQIVHAGDLSRYLTRTPEGIQAINALRNPGKVKEIAVFAIGIIIEATRQVLKKFRPEENWSKWYYREVRKRYKQLTG